MMSDAENSGSLSMADVNGTEPTGSRSQKAPGLIDVEKVNEDSTEASASFPSPEEIRASNTHPRRSMNKSRLVWCVALALVLIALVVGLSVGLSTSGSSSEKSANSQGNPTTETPPGPRATFEDIVSWVEKENISTQSALLTQGTPQNMAAQWLAHLDSAALPIPTVSVGDVDSSYGYLYMTRYVMAVIFYQMNGDNWPPSENYMNFMTGRDICSWNGVKNAIEEPNLVTEEGGIFCDEVTGLPTFLDLGKCDC
jgi:hypothetical protein